MFENKCIYKCMYGKTFMNLTTIVQNTVKIVGRICNNFEKNRALYDKSMKLGTWLVDNKTKNLRVSATPKMPSNGCHLVFPKWPPFSTFFIIISLFICKHNVFFSLFYLNSNQLYLNTLKSSFNFKKSGLRLYFFKMAATFVSK